MDYVQTSKRIRIRMGRFSASSYRPTVCVPHQSDHHHHPALLYRRAVIPDREKLIPDCLLTFLVAFSIHILKLTFSRIL